MSGISDAACLVHYTGLCTEKVAWINKDAKAI